MDLIYHICPIEDWKDALGVNYKTASLLSEGFIHCSTIHQIPRVLNTLYKDREDLLLLEIDFNLISSELRWEPGVDKPDELFPHIYGPLNKDAVLRVIDIDMNSLEQLVQSSK